MFLFKIVAGDTKLKSPFEVFVKSYQSNVIFDKSKYYQKRVCSCREIVVLNGVSICPNGLRYTSGPYGPHYKFQGAWILLVLQGAEVYSVRTLLFDSTV